VQLHSSPLVQLHSSPPSAAPLEPLGHAPGRPLARAQASTRGTSCGGRVLVTGCPGTPCRHRRPAQAAFKGGGVSGALASFGFEVQGFGGSGLKGVGLTRWRQRLIGGDDQWRTEGLRNSRGVSGELWRGARSWQTGYGESCMRAQADLHEGSSRLGSTSGAAAPSRPAVSSSSESAAAPPADVGVRSAPAVSGVRRLPAELGWSSGRAREEPGRSLGLSLGAPLHRASQQEGGRGGGANSGAAHRGSRPRVSAPRAAGCAAAAPRAGAPAPGVMQWL
jgi:hypothetical protein